MEDNEDGDEDNEDGDEEAGDDDNNDEHGDNDADPSEGEGEDEDGDGVGDRDGYGDGDEEGEGDGESNASTTLSVAACSTEQLARENWRSDLDPGLEAELGGRLEKRMENCCWSRSSSRSGRPRYPLGSLICPLSKSTTTASGGITAAGPSRSFRKEECMPMIYEQGHWSTPIIGRGRRGTKTRLQRNGKRREHRACATRVRIGQR